jgi:hypothetical protein
MSFSCGGSQLVDSRSGQRVPLASATATVVIRDFLARVCIHQKYVNNEVKPVEALYAFPMEPEGGASSGRCFPVNLLSPMTDHARFLFHISCCM